MAEEKKKALKVWGKAAPKKPEAILKQKLSSIKTQQEKALDLKGHAKFSKFKVKGDK